MTSRASWPWATTVLVVAHVAIYVLAGTMADYGTPGSADGDDLRLPSIGQLTFDAFRHPSTTAMAVTLVFLVPVAIAVERAVNAVAAGATYVVSGFGAGMAELLSATDPLAVVGAFGATTGLLAMWLVARWRLTGDVVLPAAIVLGWFLLNWHARTAGIPWLGAVAAAAIGLYAVGALPPRRAAAHDTPPVDHE